MFGLGILGICQVLFFPGIIINKYIRLPKNFFFFISTIIAFSLIINFILVFLLTVFGLFLNGVVLFLIIIELGFIIFLYRKILLNIKLDNILSNTWNSISNAILSVFPKVTDQDNKFQKSLQYGLFFVSFVIALIAIEWMSRFFRYNIGEVFNTWDAVVSWNRWAVDWASNQLPSRTQDYPQLIPANWAMIYQVAGTSQIQLFPKSIMPLFPLLILLLLFGMGFETKNPAFFLSVEIARLIIKKFSGQFIASGYVDFALTFFVLLAFVMLYLAYKADLLKEKLNYTFLSLIFAAGSVVTKQPGFFALVCILLLSILLILRKDLNVIFALYKKQIIIFLLIIGLIFIPWYLYKGVQILTGIESTHLLQPVDDTNQTHNNQSLLANLIPGLKSLGNYLYIVLFIIPSLIVMEKFWRVIAIFVVLPYVFLWASYASYDLRNLTMMFPFIALLFCLGIIGFFNLFLSISQRVRIEKTSLYLIFIIFSMVLISLNFLFTNESLEKRQIEKQKEIFSAELNTKLYEYFSTNEMDGKILTNYPVDFLPGFENSQMSFMYNDLNYLETRLFVEDVGYLLYPSSVSGEIEEFINELESKDLISHVFESSTYIPYKFAVVKK
ncbi:MAG TPA: phospholipid carrier-dependent glycosyltransferase [Anaerolineaceae bacterium]|nr:phospholipid carrier-dependent glycosyltransferase [Anaerolineaceae bacterium]